MQAPALAASENNTAISSPGLPRYFLQISENSKISPCLTERKVNDIVTLLQPQTLQVSFWVRVEGN